MGSLCVAPISSGSSGVPRRRLSTIVSNSNSNSNSNSTSTSTSTSNSNSTSTSTSTSKSSSRGAHGAEARRLADPEREDEGDEPRRLQSVKLVLLSYNI